MAVTAAAKAVMMALLQSHMAGCTSRPAASMCSTCFNRFYNSHSSTRALTSRRLLPPAGTAVTQRTMTPLAAAAAAAAGDPSSRRRRGRAPAQQQQQEQQQKLTQQGSEAAPQQAQAYAASVEKTQEQQQEQQQQQLRSRQLLWDTAAQLGLKRGSDIAPPEDTDGASIDLASDSSTGSGSRTATASRRRRSRASSSSSNSSSSSSRSDVGTAVSRSTSSSIEAVGSQSIEQDDDSVSDNVTDSLSLNSRDDAVVAAIARLGRFLDFRERCASEVLSKLGALGYDRQLAQRALQELQDAGLQSDARFAEMFVRGSWRTKTQSPTRLAYELRSRGVAQQHIDAAMTAVFGPGRQLPGRDAANDQEEEMWEQLVEMCRRRAELTRTEPKQKRRAKLAGWLQRRGHNMSTIFRVFEALGI